MTPITINGNWVESVRDSIPEHSEDIKLNLINVMENNGLDSVDAHAIAYVAAISSGNGGLGFEIEHNSPLFSDENARESAKMACSVMGMYNVFQPVTAMLGLTPAPLLHGENPRVTKKQFAMYSLAASIVGKCTYNIKIHYDELILEGLTFDQIQNIIKIVAVVSAIGKIAI
jgi:alkyl hydroperoxide reductase subunit D